MSNTMNRSLFTHVLSMVCSGLEGSIGGITDDMFELHFIENLLYSDTKPGNDCMYYVNVNTYCTDVYSYDHQI